MFFTVEKFQRRVEELGRRRYFGHQCIAPFVGMSGELPKDEVYRELPEKIAGESFGLYDMFHGRDRYFWLDRTVQFPKEREGCGIAGLFDFEEPGEGGKWMEGLLYVDGECYQGTDRNHKEVVFYGLADRQVRLTLLLWTGLGEPEKGSGQSICHQMKQADLAYLHKKTDALYYQAKALTESLLLMKPEEEYYEKLKAALERALFCIDWDVEKFYTSAERAYDVLMRELEAMGKNTDVTVHTVGHTHIDLAWLWRLKHTREKAQRSFSTVLHLMEQYDDYKFLQSQPQLYQFVKEDNPALYERIRRKIKDGQWEPEGGMWVEADCNIPAGESLVRQLLFGIRFMEREFGKKCEFLWLPDVFGYSWALPQILKQCEISTFMTIKIGWSQYNDFPNSLFKWRGMDGTEILAYFISTPDEGQPDEEWHTTYNGVVSSFTVKGCWKKFKNKELSRDVLLAYGYGDGGGSANRDMIEMGKAIDRIPGIPHVKTSAAGDFFRKIHEQTACTDRYVPTWDGELYLEYHRGTYTSQADTKKYNRRLEGKLRMCEWLSSLEYLKKGKYPWKELQESWECLLLHQFHDIIPGSSIREVYEDAEKSYRAVEKRLEKLEEKLLSDMTAKEENSYGVYCADSFGGEELIFIPESRTGSFLDEEGNALACAKDGDGYDVLVERKPFGVSNLTFRPDVEPERKTVFALEGNKLETPFYILRWDETGALDFLYDKEADRPVLKEGGKGNMLEVYEDKPMNYDAWDIDLFHVQKGETLAVKERPQLLLENGLKVVIRFIYRYRKSTVMQDMTLYGHSRRIDFHTTVDWQEDHRLLKAAFETDVRNTEAAYDSQFGHVFRPAHWNQSWDLAKFEVCGHQWADFSETDYGVGLLNDCKYGYSVKDGIMRISLLKSAKSPDPEADMGRHTFTYSLYPHMGGLAESGVIKEASRLNLPARIVGKRFTEKRQAVRLVGEGIRIDALKKAEDEDCLILRMHEYLGGRHSAVLSSDYPVKTIVPCNLLEHDCGGAAEGEQITVTLRPFEIRTYKIFYDI